MSHSNQPKTPTPTALQTEPSTAPYTNKTDVATVDATISTHAITASSTEATSSRPAVAESKEPKVHAEQDAAATTIVPATIEQREAEPNTAPQVSAEQSEAATVSQTHSTESQECSEQKTAISSARPIMPNQQWQACYEAVTGLAHRDANPPLPCQDSSLALVSPRATIIVADGAGSSAVSELGAQAVTTGLARLLNTLEQQLAQLLDHHSEQQDQKLRHFGQLLVKHAKGILDDLAVQHRRPQKGFRCTLLVAIQGTKHLLWVKVGDGAIVTETLQQTQSELTPTLTTLGSIGKGEFANHTTFIDNHLQPGDVQTGYCSSVAITGFAAMSDGAADRLVSLDGRKVSQQISTWLHSLRQGKLKRRTLTRLFSAEHFTRNTTGDDASIALCASALSE